MVSSSQKKMKFVAQMVIVREKQQTKSEKNTTRARGTAQSRQEQVQFNIPCRWWRVERRKKNIAIVR